MFNKPCKACIEKDKQIVYMHKLIDNLLSSKGIAPVVEQTEITIPETDEEKEDRALKERGAQRYGE